MTTIPEMGFTGWLKDLLPWRQVATGASYDLCLAALLNVASVGQNAERIVLPSGRRPDEKKPR